MSWRRSARTTRCASSGLHSHIGSQIFESDGFAEAARRLLAVHAALLAGGDVPELNLGGGFGIAYTSADEVDADRADRGRLRARRVVRVRGPRHPGAGRRDRAGPRDHRPVDRDAVRGRHDEARRGRWLDDGHPPLRERRRRHERQRAPRALRRRLLGAHREPGRRMPTRPSCASPASTASPATSSCTPTTCPATSPPATCSPCPRPAPTAGRWPATTTTSAVPPSSPCATARRASSCAARPRPTCSPATRESQTMIEYRNLRVALLGAGSVGAQVASLLLEHGDELAGARRRRPRAGRRRRARPEGEARRRHPEAPDHDRRRVADPRRRHRRSS